MRQEGQVGLGILAAVGVVVLIVIFAFMAVFGVGMFKRTTANFRGETNVIEQTKANAAFRIAAYDHFYDLCASVQAIEATLDASLTELLTAPPSDVDRVRTNLTGLQAQRSRGIAQYNVDARKSYTIGQFKGNDLPYQLSTETYKKGNTTSCES